MTDDPAAHDDLSKVPVAAEIVATWPVGYFAENIAILPGGDFVVSVHNKRELHRVALNGSQEIFASMPASPAGLVAVADGVFVAAGEPGQGPHHIFKVTLDGTVAEFLTVPDTLFLNGFTPVRPGFAYAVDSIMGVVIEINLEAAASRVVLRHERLGKCTSEPMLPGANGIKAGEDGLYITNTDRALILHAPFGPDGLAGDLEIVAENLRGDDLAIGANGDLFITTHINNTLIQLKPGGARIAIAGPAQGMVGATSCIFHPGAPNALFVTTTGGLIMPYNGVVQEAKLVRLDAGVAGRPFPF